MQKNDSGIKSNSTTHGNPVMFSMIYTTQIGSPFASFLLWGKIAYYVQSHTNKVKYSLLLVPPCEKWSK